MDNEYKKFIYEIKEGKIRNSYLLLGENDFLKEVLIRNLENKIINPNSKSIDRIVVDGEDMDSDIITWLATPPMSSGKKLLVIKHVERLSRKIRTLIQKWLDNPSEKTVVVLTANKNGFKNISTCKCWRLYESEIPQWISTFFLKPNGFKMEPEALTFLQQILGTDIQILGTEIEKLMNFVLPRKTITLQDVKEIETQEISGSIFDLTHKVAERDFNKASSLLNLLFDLGETPTRILWQIYSHFDKLLKLKNEPHSPIKVHKYYLPKYKYEASLWSKAELLKAFSHLFDTEFLIKSGKVRANFAIHELIYQLCMTKE